MAQQRSPADSLIPTDLLLLALGAPPFEGELNGITRLQKLLYLSEQETPIMGDVVGGFDFVAYNYGPFSKQIHEGVDLLERLGLVRETRVFQPTSYDEMEEYAVAAEPAEPEGTERRFHLSEKGTVVANILAQKHPRAFAQVAQIKQRYGRMPLRQLLQYVYATYPPSAENSVIKGQVLGQPRP